MSDKKTNEKQELNMDEVEDVSGGFGNNNSDTYICKVICPDCHQIFDVKNPLIATCPYCHKFHTVNECEKVANSRPRHNKYR